jgi:hypothetical protein
MDGEILVSSIEYIICLIDACLFIFDCTFFMQTHNKSRPQALLRVCPFFAIISVKVECALCHLVACTTHPGHVFFCVLFAHGISMQLEGTIRLFIVRSVFRTAGKMFK